MSIRKWPKVKLYGYELMIPAICPNCLVPGVEPIKTCYPPSRSLFEDRYYQTFQYCSQCARQVREFEKYYRRRNYLSVFLFFPIVMCSLAGFGVLFVERRAPFRVDTGGLLLIAFIIWTAATVGLIYWITLTFKGRFIKRVPVQPSQAVWGAAAYYCASDNESTTYRAVRKEWLVSLVAANPRLVDDATYVSLVGHPKPVTAKPFA